MSARRHLSEGEFGKLPLSEIMQLPTVDARESLGEKTVADVLGRKRADMAKDPGTYSLLRSSMKKGQTAPIGIRNGVVIDGMHRIALAKDLGISHLFHTPDRMRTEDESWNRMTGHMP